MGFFIPGFRTGRRIKALYFPFIGFFPSFNFFRYAFYSCNCTCTIFNFIFYRSVRVFVLILSIKCISLYLLFDHCDCSVFFFVLPCASAAVLFRLCYHNLLQILALFIILFNKALVHAVHQAPSTSHTP